MLAAPLFFPNIFYPLSFKSVLSVHEFFSPCHNIEHDCACRTGEHRSFPVQVVLSSRAEAFSRGARVDIPVQVAEGPNLSTRARWSESLGVIVDEARDCD